MLKTNDNNIKENLKYLGLDLNKIPKKYKEFSTLDFRPSKFGDERKYKIYKYLDVNDIEILLTPTNRLCDISEKYSKAAPLYAYLEPEDETDIERYTMFLKMLKNVNKEEIEQIQKEQQELNKKIPFAIKYAKDYLWQIYYSEYTQKYFMLVTTEDLDYSAFFYLLKAQLSKKQTKIFVPISYMDYSREFLNRNQIEEIEKYLCFFTKEWPLVYEVCNKEETSTLQISGQTNVYDDIKSQYKIKIINKEDAEKFYKLLKALFILQTQLPHYYKFNVKIDYRGNLNFYFGNKKIIYEILSSIIKEEYIKAEDLTKENLKLKETLENEIKDLKVKSTKLELNFIEKEKQISMFLECRKTFLGRVKYFLKTKKTSKSVTFKKANNDDKKKENEKIEFIQYEEIKDYYTLEELVNLYKAIEQNETYIKNLKLDLTALTNRITNIESKIKNAKQYIEEIEKHKKSIFEFWKFTNKEKISELPQGEGNEKNTKKIKKVFNYELDFEDLSIKLDKRQREIMSQEELNSIYLTSTYILEDINKVLNGEKISEERLKELKKKASENKVLFNKENFDIFGAIESNNTNLKTLANKKHRETQRELFKILDISSKTTIQEYTKMINQVIQNLDFAIKRMNTNIELPIYLAKDNLDTINAFNMNPEKAIYDFKNNGETQINLYKIRIKEDSPILALTNIIYYYNNNRTLPLGMNISEGILINNKLIDFKEKNVDKFNIVTYEEPENELSKIIIKKVNVIELEIK